MAVMPLKTYSKPLLKPQEEVRGMDQSCIYLVSFGYRSFGLLLHRVSGLSPEREAVLGLLRFLSWSNNTSASVKTLNQPDPVSSDLAVRAAA